MAFNLRILDRSGISWWHLIAELVEMGIEFRLCGGPHYCSPLSNIAKKLFEGPEFRSQRRLQDAFSLSSQGAFDLLSWLGREAFDLPHLDCPFRLPFPGNELRPWHGFMSALNAQKQSEDIAAMMGCGVLSMAVLRRDENSVKKILEQRPRLLGTERNILGHTAIHLAIGWPEGLRILLAAADERTRQNIDDAECRCDGGMRVVQQCSPLDYAFAFGCIESIRLLADADFKFNFEWNLRIGTDALDPPISDILLVLFLERFRQFRDFTVQNVPAEVVRALRIEDLEFFDSDVRHSLYYLRINDIQIPRKFFGHQHPWDIQDPNPVGYFVPRFGGVFHQEGLHPKTARAFFRCWGSECRLRSGTNHSAHDCDSTESSDLVDER
ncbi:hypothetical protein EV356DRAFT_279311 [Viridothelium virens]|uniref:Ankyrin n=1 Tax=Viridothelium virens TaxID=1048519 RepID=A0A6A6H1G3_VIRVR|nr:hypothetical protein EV356DRAFT_279311 [Viridothelium virens]